MNTEVNLTRKLWTSFRGYTGCCKTFITANSKKFVFEIYKKNYKLDSYDIDRELNVKMLVKELEKAVHKIKLQETTSKLNDLIKTLKETNNTKRGEDLNV